jgi:neutral amino acid transport system substrate-binding protein
MALAAVCTLLTGACAPAAEQSTDGIAVGAILPFTGKEAALGRNLEQALLLAIADVNAAGGIAGQKLRLVTRDSNSGSARGLEQLLQLLYTDKVKYLIGPEETDLANAIVPDVKGLDVLDLLPAYAAPAIERPANQGAWVRLAPSTNALGCAMGKQVVRDGAGTMNALVSADDYNSGLASDFMSHVTAVGGTPLPSITVPPGASSYKQEINRVFDIGADVTLLTVPPESAATIATEWAVADRRGAWYLSPLLHADVFLQNIPFGALNGVHGLSPSSSLPSECTPVEIVDSDPDAGGDSGAGGAGGAGGASGGDTDSAAGGAAGAGGASDAPDSSNVDAGHDELNCTHNNARAFAAHFAHYWQGDQPFPAANYYYDAVVLLALGLNKGLSDQGVLPTTRELHSDIRALGNPENQPVRWNNLRQPLTEIRLGTDVRYVGAAAEYEFDVYGAAQHSVFDTWTIADDGFVETGTFEPFCPQAL